MSKSHSPGFLKIAEKARASIKEISPEEFRHEMTNNHQLVLLDVREDHEWNAGSIVGATHLGRGILERDIESKYPDKDAAIVLYCGGGYRSALAALSLEQMGYTNVRSLAGGYRLWTELGFDTVKGTKK
jgi:rhodanese-related sulfurtransferase